LLAMRIRSLLALALVLAFCACGSAQPPPAGEMQPPVRHTVVSIVGDQFYINGRPTYEGQGWSGHRIEGLLFNARMVQGIFDDLNPETRHLWVHPDTHE